MPSRIDSTSRPMKHWSAVRPIAFAIIALLLIVDTSFAQDSTGSSPGLRVVPLDDAPTAGTAITRHHRHRGQSLSIILPTSNHALFEDDGGAEFYQHTVRSGDDAWKGGRYGYVRDERHTKHGIVWTRFHEGMDIRPLYRDDAGVPLDTVHAIDDGVVVYANAVANRSNYGRYVVVRHIWENSPYYSLYAHLNEVWVDSGDPIKRGGDLGRLGYTGDGINRERAHVHFEIGLMISDDFEEFHEKYWPNDSNWHGNYNGINLYGLDVARLYTELHADPTLTIEKFIASEPVSFAVTIPNTGVPNLLRRYPWMLRDSSGRQLRAPSHGGFDNPAWKIYFADSGLPLRIEPSNADVTDAVVSQIPDTTIAYRYVSKGLLRGQGDDVGLSRFGERLVELMMLGDPNVEVARREAKPKQRHMRAPVDEVSTGVRER